MVKVGHYAKAIAFAKSLLWVKNYSSQNRAKNYSRTGLELLCAKKTALKNTYYSKNNTFYNMAKFGQYAKAIAVMKLSHWVKN